MIYILVVLALLAGAGPANAGPVAALVGLLTTVGTTTIFGSAFLWSVAKVAVSTLLSKAFQKKPNVTQSGISRETTTQGGVMAQSFMLGWYATGGHGVCPPLSHGANNKYLTYVLDLGDIPIAGLDQVMINSDLVDFSGAVHADYAAAAVGKYAGKAWLKFHDGTQTVSDPMLLDKYGSHPDFAWAADMVGTGIPYAILTFDFDRELYSGYPDIRFVANGIPLYDLRKDSTVGGVGLHRWDDQTTWEATVNPAVMVYNIKRNITLADGSVWGLSVAVEDLPVSEWAAAMNVCDEQMALSGGGTEARYRAGFEVSLNQEPLDVIAELLKTCSGEVAEVGGTWHINIGDPALPIYFMTDDDLVRTKDESKDPFPSLQSTYNAVTASHPLPSNNWEVHDAPPRYNAVWEAEDGGRRLPANIELGAVPYPAQVQRVMQELGRDHRRMITHSIPLPPEAIICRPLQTISWTSAYNQYTNKLFEVNTQVVDTTSLYSRLIIRERDPSDYNWQVTDEVADDLPTRPIVVVPPIVVGGFTAEKATIQDGTSADRRPAIKVLWDAAQFTFQGVEWEIVTTADGRLVVSGSTSDVSRGYALVSEGILPAVAYNIRVSAVSASPTPWSNWLTITTDDIRLELGDLDAGIGQSIIDADTKGSIALQANTDLANDVLPRISTNETDIVTAQVARVDMAADITRLQAVSTAIGGDFSTPVGVGNLDTGLDDWTTSAYGEGDAGLAISSNVTEVPTTDIKQRGVDFRMAGYGVMYSRAVYPIDPSRKYRLRARVKRETYDSGTSLLYVGFVKLQGDLTVDATQGAGGHNYPAASALSPAAFPVGADFVEFVSLDIITGVGGGSLKFGNVTEYVRPLVFGNYGDANPLNVMLVSGLFWEDVTDLVNLQANIDAEKIVRANADIAIASDVTTLEAKVGTGAVAINPNLDFRNGEDGWSGSATSKAPLSSRITITPTQDGNSSGNDLVAAARADFYSEDAILVNSTDIIRITGRFKRDGLSGAITSARLYLGFQCLDASGVALGNRYCAANNISSGLPIDGAFHVFTGTMSWSGAPVHSTFPAGTASIKAMCLMNYGSVNAGDVMRVSECVIENVTAGESMSAKTTMLALAQVEANGRALAQVGMVAETQDVNGIPVIAGFYATSFSNPDGTSGSFLQLMGMDVFVDGRMSSTNYAEDGNGDPTAGWLADGPNDVIKGKNIIGAIMIVDGATAKTSVLTRTSSKTFTNTSSALEPVFTGVATMGLEAYRADPFPPNPLGVTVSGAAVGGTTPTQLRFAVQGRNGAGAWTNLSLKMMAPIYLYRGETQNFSVEMVDDGVGINADAFEDHRVVAYLVISGTYTGTTATVSSQIIAQFEQLNR